VEGGFIVMNLSEIKARALYLVRLFGFLPITLVKRVLLGKDPVWKAFFFQSWALYPEEVSRALRARPNIWINTEAGGELTQINTLCKRIKEEYPDHSLILSTHKYDSYLVAGTMKGVDLVLFSPWDIRLAARRALRQIQPRALIVIEVATAPALVKEAHAMGVTTILCSGFMSKGLESHPFLARAMSLDCYRAFDWIGAKNPGDAQGFRSVAGGRAQVEVLGDLKFDIEHLRLNHEERLSLRRELGLRDEEALIVAGSIHSGEEQIVTEAYIQARKRKPNLRLLLAPRWTEMVPSLERYLQGLGLSSVRRSQVSSTSPEPESIIILDTFGELGRIYGVAFCCVIGSSLCPVDPLGGHNIIEPLVHGVPIFHGPHMLKYEELVEELDGTWPSGRVTCAEELARAILELLEDPDLVKEIRTKYEEVISRGRQSIENHVRFIKKALPRN
jgi:3-deoxy-D-manno-octulosonic-acid transferase